MPKRGHGKRRKRKAPKLSRDRSAARLLSAGNLHDKQILDTSAWNALLDDPRRDDLVEILQTTTVIPTTLSISEILATPDAERRHALIRLVKTVGQDKRPLAMPNQLIILACQGYARRDKTITLNEGGEAEGAWMVLNDPALVDAEAQRRTREFNEKRESILRNSTEGLRSDLQALATHPDRPRSMAALIRHYNRSDDFLYRVVNPIYERAVGRALPRHELRRLFRSLPIWPMFLMGYACAIYQRAVKEQGFSHRRNPGHLDLWSATYLPFCECFVTDDKQQRRTLKIINKGNARPARIASYNEWRNSLL